MATAIRHITESNLRVVIRKDRKNVCYLTSQIDPTKPILKLVTPLHLDVSLGNKCSGGCPYCYADSKKDGIYYEHIEKKLISLVSALGDRKPFQIAIGGECEPTQHPNFINFLKTCYDLGIVPNYTTNALKIDENTLKATENYCGCVGISTHPHLIKAWKKNLLQFLNIEVNTRLHVIVGEKHSSDYFIKIYNEYYDLVKGITILVMRNTGRGSSPDCMEEEFLKTINFLRSNDYEKIALTELSQPLLLKYQEETKFLDLPEFEIGTYGGYVILDESYMTIRESSFEIHKIKNILS